MWHGRADRDEPQICLPGLYFPTLFSCYLHETLHPALYFTFPSYEMELNKNFQLAFLMYVLNLACAKSCIKYHIGR